MLKLRIEVDGSTELDLEEGLEEVLRSVGEGNTSGFDHNDTGRYFFEITGDSEAERVEIG